MRHVPAARSWSHWSVTSLHVSTVQENASEQSGAVPGWHSPPSHVSMPVHQSPSLQSSSSSHSVSPIVDAPVMINEKAWLPPDRTPLCVTLKVNELAPGEDTTTCSTLSRLLSPVVAAADGFDGFNTHG